MDDPTDYVRQEVAAGLKKGNELLLIPVLVRGANLPAPDLLPDDLKALSFRNALALSHQDWEGNLQKLVDTVRSAVSKRRTQPLSWSQEDPVIAHIQDQIDWYNAKSSRCQKQYKRIKILQTTAACIIPVCSILILSVDMSRGLRAALALSTALLGIEIAVLEGILQLQQYQQIWVTYRATCAALVHETFNYLAGAGIYSAPGIDPRTVLAERAETIGSQENAKWTSLQQPQKDAKAGT